MRPRIAVLASVLTTLVAVAAPGIASAHPHHNRGLTIAATPNPINSGDGVLIYGQLKASAVSGQTIYLYHHIAGNPGFSLIGHTTTNSFGFYDFTREEGVVLTNRSWFVRGPDKTHSRTIRESVHALVSLASDAMTTNTGQPVHLTGTVSPEQAHRFERVILREQVGLSGNAFRTIDTTRTNAAGAFSFVHRWARPGQHTVEAVFRGDARNSRGESDTITVSIEQKQLAGFTIHSSRPIIAEGTSVTLSGVLDMPGTTTPEPSASVTLYGHTVGQDFRAIATTVTATDGSYSFTQSPIHNEVYRVRTTLAPHRATAALYEGVQDVVTLTAKPTTATVGGQVTFSGNVTPDKAGHLIYLQRKDAAGNWDFVGVGVVKPGSTYSFTRVFGQAGTKEFRTRIFGGPDNVGGASAPIMVTVAGVTPLGTLPPAS